MGLTVKKIAALKTPGRYAEGSVRGLKLQITPTGVKSWLLRYERFGRERWMGLGPVDVIDLEEARERALRARRQLLDGMDPLDARRAERAAAALEAAKMVTFKQAAEAYNEQHEKKWKNRKAAAQFLNTLRDYAFGLIGNLSVAAIDAGQVLRVLEQKHKKYPNQRLWDAIPETASRLRGRIESVLDWAAVRGLRTGDNPARWKGHLAEALPARGEIQKTEHHAALAYPELPAFLTELRQREGVAPQALEFTILTAARTGEAIGATWDEIDLPSRTWTVPATRMKAGKPHKVPLSDRAIELLKVLPQEKGNAFVFIGPKKGTALSNMAMLSLLRRMDRADITTHGFRSTFRDWVADKTAYPNIVGEAALAHVVGDKVEAAYRRGDLFEKRRRLMADWAKFCASVPGDVAKASKNVVSIRAAAP